MLRTVRLRLPHPRSMTSLMIVALAVTACSSGTSNKVTSESSRPTTAVTSAARATPAAPAAASMSVHTAAGLGAVLVDASGRTLYLFEKDRGSTSSCSGQCAQVWPPFTSVGPSAAGAGASAALVATSRRTDGTSQVTYAGHPLYYYVNDQQPGQTNGQGLNQFGAKWYVLSAKGTKVDKD